MEPIRVIIKKSDDVIPPIPKKEEVPLPGEIENLKKESILNTDNVDLSALGDDKVFQESITSTNKVDAIVMLISNIGEIRYKFSHLYNVINKEASIDEIESNWLVIGTKDDDGNIIPEQVELRKKEFELFIKQ